MKTIQYKEYQGQYDYDPEAGLFHGTVTNMEHVVTFQAKTEAELPRAMAESVECCLEFCLECGLDG
jgi:predicted HicB family RNase H-like nuclease